MSNFDNHHAVIANLKKAGKSQDVVYPYAFGMVWAWLSEKARAEIIKATEKMVEESEKN